MTAVQERKDEPLTFEKLPDISKGKRKLDRLFGIRFDDMVEFMVVPNLVARFSELGYVFEDTTTNKEINDPSGETFFITPPTAPNKPREW
ncbi:hypothetical protein AGMMS49944_27170 [Spirochaetia bacterium]|nr:hypothetical protein AGMMS49944_27170 [Spirochaetia bacterium]